MYVGEGCIGEPDMGDAVSGTKLPFIDVTSHFNGSHNNSLVFPKVDVVSNNPLSRPQPKTSQSTLKLLAQRGKQTQLANHLVSK